MGAIASYVNVFRGQADLSTIKHRLPSLKDLLPHFYNSAAYNTLLKRLNCSSMYVAIVMFT